MAKSQTFIWLIIYCLWSKKIHKWKYLVYKNIDINHTYWKKLLRVPLWIEHDVLSIEGHLKYRLQSL